MVPSLYKLQLSGRCFKNKALLYKGDKGKIGLLLLDLENGLLYMAFSDEKKGALYLNRLYIITL